MAPELFRNAVGVFPTHQDAEAALRDLRDSGYTMSQVSLVTRDPQTAKNVEGAETTGVNQTHDTARDTVRGAVTGGTIGGIIGIIGGVSALTIPGIGPVVASGVIASILAETVVGTAVGATAGGLVGAFAGMGIPEEKARSYHSRVTGGEYLLVVQGTEEELRQAGLIFKTHGVQDWGVYESPNARRALDEAGRPHRALGVFSDRAETERAIQALKDSGFSTDNVSVVAKYEGAHDIGGVGVEESLDQGPRKTVSLGALGGGALGGLGGLLVGLGLLALPGIGHIVLAGVGATALANAIAGGALGATAGGLIGALVGLGVPEEQAKAYNHSLSQGKYIVMVHGSAAEVRNAETILRQQGVQDWGIYQVPESERAGATTGTPETRFPPPRRDEGPRTGPGTHH